MIQKFLQVFASTSTMTRGFLGIVFVLMIALVGCLGIDVDSNRSGQVYIEDPVMAKGIGEDRNPLDPTNVFKTTDARIYCTIAIQGPDHVKLGARWYYGDQLISSDQFIDLGTRHRGAWFLQASPGQNLMPGDYRVEIFSVKSPDKIVHFKVIE
ncbi:MAG: hypothetical protein WCF84_13190 [Anaerolineae bacterium]